MFPETCGCSKHIREVWTLLLLSKGSCSDQTECRAGARMLGCYLRELVSEKEVKPTCLMWPLVFIKMQMPRPALDLVNPNPWLRANGLAILVHAEG